MKMIARQKRYRYTNQMVGAFVLLTLAIFVLTVLSSSSVKRWWDPGLMLKVVMPSEGLFGLSEGAEVEILGTKAGSVKKIVIDPSQQMHAIVRIRTGMQAFIRSDSTATIRKRFGVAGDSYLVISRGSADPLDWDYAVIDAIADRAPTDTVGELIDEVRNKIFPVITDTQKAIHLLLAVVEDLQDPKGDMQVLLKNMNAISGRITRGEGVIGRLLYEDSIVDEMQQLVNQLSSNMTRLEPIFNEVEVITKNVAGISVKLNEQSQDLPEVIQKLKDTLTSVQAVMQDLKQTTPQLPKITENISDATSSVPVLMLQTQQVMAELERLIKQLQSHWLLGGGGRGNQPATSRISPLEVKP